jgi:hypothetical protein
VGGRKLQQKINAIYPGKDKSCLDKFIRKIEYDAINKMEKGAACPRSTVKVKLSIICLFILEQKIIETYNKDL